MIKSLSSKGTYPPVNVVNSQEIPPLSLLCLKFLLQFTIHNPVKTRT